MKGSVGTSTYITYVGGRPKQKYKVRGKGYFCTSCRGWIKKGQWFKYTSRGTTRHFYKSECSASPHKPPAAAPKNK